MYNQLLLSLRIGDGSYITQTRLDENKRYCVSFNSKELDYVVHKKLELEKLGIPTSNIQFGKSGYKRNSTIYVVRTRVHPLLTEIGNLNVLDVINNLDKTGLMYYYLDDGSYHIHRHTMHLYCNSFNSDEVYALVDKIYKLYPQKKCSVRIDKKKDGRQYPYLYIPRKVVEPFKEDVHNFLIEKDLPCYLYKIGQPSTTIEMVSE